MGSLVMPVVISFLTYFSKHLLLKGTDAKKVKLLWVNKFSLQPPVDTSSWIT